MSTASMAPLLLLLLSVSITGSTVVDLQKRIIGGQPCERQYHVKLKGVAAGGSSNMCGGSLISDRWILTAAHCLKPGRFSCASRGSSTRSLAQITAEPVIYTDKDNRFHDIMLLQLPEPTKIQPVALPDCEYYPKMVEIAGHAATTGGPNKERKPSSSPTLHCADIEVVSCENLNKTLQAHFPNVYQVKQYQHWFCGQTPGVDICYGDSGGGVVYEDKIYGIISFLGDPDNVCRKAAAFIELCNSEYITWIHRTIS